MSVCYIYIYIYILIPWRNSPLRAKACQPSAGLTSTCPQTGVNDHLASLGTTCGHKSSLPALAGMYSCMYGMYVCMVCMNDMYICMYVCMYVCMHINSIDFLRRILFRSVYSPIRSRTSLVLWPFYLLRPSIYKTINDIQ